MTSATLTRDRTPPAAPQARGSVVLAGIAAAAWVVALAWAAIVGFAIVAWSTAGSTASSATATRLGSQLWLLVHHVALELHGPDGGSVTLVPLGLTIGVIALMYRGGIVAARSCGARTLTDCGRTAAAFAVPYATVAVVIAGASRTPGVSASVWQAATYPGLLALAVSGVAAVRHVGVQEELLARVPVAVRAVARGVLTLFAGWMVATLALVAVAAVINASRVEAVIAGVHAGSIGSSILLVVTLFFVPNAAAWAGSYAIGAGVSVGPVAVSPFAVTGGALPSLPPLALLPQTTPVPALQLLVFALPVLMVWAGWRLERRAARASESWLLPYGRTAGLAIGGSAVIAALAVLTSGTVGRIAMGPQPLRDGAFAFASTVVAGVLVATLRTWQRCDPRVKRLVVAVRRRIGAAREGVRSRLPGRG